MKKKLPRWIVALGLMVVFSGAGATVVNDTYHGGNGHGYGDVIGPATYKIDSMDSSLSGTQLTVTIYTNFAGNAGIEQQWTKNNTGIGYGDLFLSSGWTPNGSSPYTNDTAANGNHWTFAFSLDDPLSNSGGNGAVYALGVGSNSNHNPDVLLSNDFMNCAGHCVYRDGQAVAVNKSKATATGNTGTWTVGNGFLSFSFDTAGLGLDVNSFGFDWTMYCGNDVIQGLADPTVVPEPAPVGLFLVGMGLIGLGVVRRRKIAQRF